MSHARPIGTNRGPGLQRRRAGPRLGYAASKWCVMRMKRQQVEPGTLKRVMKYLGKREPSPPSIDHTQPMETIGGSESEDTTYLSALLPRIEQLPPGIVVEETEMGRATAQWIVQIRCECGRRWFDVQMVKTARCPRCEMMAVVKPID